jgi:hypothetical protein
MSSGSRADLDIPRGRGGPSGQSRSTGGLGWLMLLPIACCGGPLLIAALAAAGAILWGSLGAGLAVIATVVLVVRRRHRACCLTETSTGVLPERPGCPDR